jgi:hypothetical protein
MTPAAVIRANQGSRGGGLSGSTKVMRLNPMIQSYISDM